MTPKMRMAMDVLQMNSMELRNFIQKKMEENPLLEREKEFMQNERSEAYIRDTAAHGDGEGEREKFKKFMAYQPNLLEHMEKQIMEFLRPSEMKIGKMILRKLNNRGLLSIECDEMAAELGIGEEKVEEVRQKIMRMDPAGMAAFSPREALEIQLEKLGEEEGLAVELLKKNYENIENKTLDQLCSSLEAEKEEIKSALERLKQLYPHPAENFSGRSNSTKYLEPDIIIKKAGEDFIIQHNERVTPPLKINREYYRKLKKHDEETAEYIQDKMQSALWLQRAIEQRRMTVEKIAKQILAYQQEFFNKGIKYLKPLTMREIAEEVDVHHSTVSRAVKDKLIQTERGLYELKFFFAQGVKGVATPAIKALISSYIKDEDKSTPLSDKKIAEKLAQEESIEISRRTVAKYRKSLEIPSSKKRKNWQHSHP